MGRAEALHHLTLHEARGLLDRREISAAELTDDVLGRIAAVEPQVEAFVTVTAELAREQAQRADAVLSKGEGHSLTGIPMQVKDVICTRECARHARRGCWSTSCRRTTRRWWSG